MADAAADEVDLTMVTMTFDAADPARLQSVLARYVVLSRGHPGCRNIDLAMSSTRPNRFVIVQKWAAPRGPAGPLRLRRHGHDGGGLRRAARRPTRRSTSWTPSPCTTSADPAPLQGPRVPADVTVVSRACVSGRRVLICLRTSAVGHHGAMARARRTTRGPSWPRCWSGLERAPTWPSRPSSTSWHRRWPAICGSTACPRSTSSPTRSSPRCTAAWRGFTGDWAGFRSWVFTIAHHRMVDDARRARRRPPVAMAEVAEEAADGRCGVRSARRARRTSVSTASCRSSPTTSGRCCSCASWPTSRSRRPRPRARQDRRRGEVPPAPGAGLAAAIPRAGRGRSWLLTSRLAKAGAVSRRDADAFDQWMARFAELDDAAVDELLRGPPPRGTRTSRPSPTLAVAVRGAATAPRP